MDKETRKKLKNAGKAEVERQSAELRSRLKEASPVEIGDPRWAENYKEITLKERDFKANRSRVYPGSFIGTEFLLNPVSFDWSRGYLAVQGYYLYCASCSDLVPMDPETDIQCSCKSISIYPSSNEIRLNPELVKVTKLIAKASTEPMQVKKKWWQLWR